MRLATITNWDYGLTVFLALAAGTTTLLASKAQEEERAAVEQRYRLDQATSKIATEVTALSDQAREYVITGDPIHLVIYRREAAALRSIEERVRSIKDVGADAEELSALTDAMSWADTLQGEQRRAMTAHERGNDDEARRILFGASYDRELDRVASDIERFQYRLDQRTDAEIVAATNVARVWKIVSEVVLVVTALLVLWVLFFLIKQRVLRPVVRLSDVINRLAAQDYGAEPPQIDHIDEIGDMAQAIRIFRENGLERQRLEAERNADLTMRALLSRMTQRMQGCETVVALERVIESFLPEIFPDLAGRLYLLDEHGTVLVETCSWLGPAHSGPQFPLLACWAMQRGDLHRPRGRVIDVPCAHLDGAAGTLDSICLPLIAQRTTLGLLYLEPHQQSSGQSTVPETYLEMLAENISLALGNLRLRDALREMAMGDALTGLANRRHLDTVIELRLEEAQRLGQSISCLMVDVDHFKRFNDQFGHEAGDEVLRAMGRVLSHSMRESGVAFRYGGEEFLLLMPQLDPQQAARRAEQIQAEVRAIRVQHGGRELGQITASFGLASAPDHCGFAKLVETADAALYRAKEAGRDRIVVAHARASDRTSASLV